MIDFFLNFRLFFSFKELVFRLFVIIIMGYIDYGKIIFLDVFRKFNVVLEEFGGII